MHSIKLIYPNSPYYPPTFFDLVPVPTVLFAIGNLSLLKEFSIGVVGARACCQESIHLTQQFVAELCQKNITILSGMADGIDHVAHEACLQNHGKTIAIIGSGLDIAKKEPIFQKILDNDGLILSEYFPDIPAMKYHFPRRNQLLVALSQGVIAIETHLKSGTMITASEALKQKKPLFTIPGSLYEERWQGNNFLLTQGAYCACSCKDILQKLKELYPSEEEFTLPSSSRSTRPLPPEYQKIYCQLSKKPQNINQLSQNLKLPLQDLQSTLTLMELEDYIFKKQNQYFCVKERHSI